MKTKPNLFSLPLIALIAMISAGLNGCLNQNDSTSESSHSEIQPDVRTPDVRTDDSSPVATTREEALMDLAVERESGIYQFNVVLTKDLSTQIETIQGLRITNPNGSSSIFQPENLSKGYVMQRKSGRDVVTISSQDFSLETGGTLNMHYLYAAGMFSDSYRDFKMALGKNSEGRWELSRMNPDGSLTSFTKMKLLVNTRAFIGVVGIREIVTE